MLIRLWKVVLAIPTAVCLFWLIIINYLTTSELNKMPDDEESDLVLIAFSFDTKTDKNSINRHLAENVLLALRINCVKTIILQEEVYLALLAICPDVNLKGKELIVVNYGSRKYLNSYEVASEALGAVTDLSNSSVLVVSHNHMFVRVRDILEKLGAEVSAYMTVVDYDAQANQSWVRSCTRFALREFVAYLLFVFKGYI